MVGKILWSLYHHLWTSLNEILIFIQQYKNFVILRLATIEPPLLSQFPFYFVELHNLGASCQYSSTTASFGPSLCPPEPLSANFTHSSPTNFQSIPFCCFTLHTHWQPFLVGQFFLQFSNQCHFSAFKLLTALRPKFSPTFQFLYQAAYLHRTLTLRLHANLSFLFLLYLTLCSYRHLSRRHRRVWVDRDSRKADTLASIRRRLRVQIW